MTPTTLTFKVLSSGMLLVLATLFQASVAPSIKIGVLESDKQIAKLISDKKSSGSITVEFVGLPETRTDRPEYDRLTEIRDIINSRKVAMVVAREDPTILMVTESLSLPYMTMTLSRCSGKFQFCFLPQTEQLGQSMVDIVEAYNIGRFALVYDESWGGLGLGVSQHFILQPWTTVKLWRLDGNVTDHEIRRTFGIAAMDNDIHHYVLAVKPTIIERILKEARYLSILGRYNKWVVLNPGFEYIGYHNFKHIKPNVSQVTLIDNIEKGHRHTSLTELIFSDMKTVLIDVGMALIGWNGDLEGKVLRDQLITKTYEGISGNIAFDAQGRRANFTLGISNLESTTPFQSARWVSTIGDTLFKKRLQFTGFEADLSETSLNSGVARVVIIQEPPFVMRRHRFEELSGNARWRGYSIDLIEDIARNLKFRYELYEVPDGNFGAKNKYGEWNGIVRDLLNGNATMSVAPLSINAEREQAIDFSKPFKYRGVSVIMKKVAPQTSFLQFLYPFHGLVWFCVLLAVVLVSVLNYFYENRCRAVREEGAVPFDWYESFWFVFGAIAGGSTESSPVTIPARLVTSAWWFFALILVSSYTANLAAFLTVRKIRAPISTVTDLAHQTEVKYGSVTNSAALNFLKYTNIDNFNKMYLYMTTVGVSDMVRNSSEGIRRVKEGNYAFIWDSTVINYEVSKHCELMAIGPEFDSTKGFGVALPAGAPYREQMTMAVLNLSDSGRLGELEHKWWTTSTCHKDSSDDDETPELKLDNVAGVFFVLLGGVVLSLLFFLCEQTPCMKRWRKSGPVKNVTNRTAV